LWGTCCPPQAACLENPTATCRPTIKAGEAPRQETTRFYFSWTTKTQLGTEKRAITATKPVTVLHPPATTLLPQGGGLPRITLPALKWRRASCEGEAVSAWAP